MTKNKQKLKDLTQIGVTAALLCVLAPISIPIGDVPLSIATLVILVSASVSGMWKSTVAVLVYLILGCVGLPVFSGFSGGIGRILGPTGGYLLGYVPMTVIAGIGKGKNTVLRIILMVAGTTVLYAAGTVWYCFYGNVQIGAALAVCVIPCLPFDAVKIAVAAVVGRRMIKMTT